MSYLAYPTSFYLLVAGLIVTSSGCGAADQGSSAESDVASATQNLSGHNVAIYFSDNRTASNVTVTLAGKDSVTGNTYSDWEATGGDMPGTTYNLKKLSWMAWNTANADMLDEAYYTNGLAADHYSIIRIDDMNSKAQFRSMRVTVHATIAGACHEDYQDIDLSNNVVLYFNGNGASWDGSCYRGDMLRTTK